MSRIEILPKLNDVQIEWIKEDICGVKKLMENMDKVMSTGDAKHRLVTALPSVLAVADPVGGERQSDTESLRGEPEMQGF